MMCRKLRLSRNPIAEHSWYIGYSGHVSVIELYHTLIALGSVDGSDRVNPASEIHEMCPGKVFTIL